jgi:hypothetical protein
MVVRSDRNGGTTYIIVTQPDENGWCSAYDTTAGEVVEGLLDMAEPVWDSATVGALSGVVRSLYNEPTMHARPAHVDRISDAEPVIVWYIERAHKDDHEWLRESGAWGSMPDGHRDPPICCDTEADAWLAAYHAHRDAAGTTANDIEVLRG